VGASAPVPQLRPCWLLRRFLEPARPSHYEAPGHPIIEGYDPPEGWGWCYADEVAVNLRGNTTPQPAPIPRYFPSGRDFEGVPMPPNAEADSSILWIEGPHPRRLRLMCPAGERSDTTGRIRSLLYRPHRPRPDRLLPRGLSYACRRPKLLYGNGQLQTASRRHFLVPPGQSGRSIR
jgi:hypothetical protein